MSFDTPQDAEDAYYDALEAGDAAAMTRIWEDSDDIACLLPMGSLVKGREVQRLWQLVFEQGGRFDLQVRHLSWIEAGDLTIHLLEERASARPGSKELPPLYATNIFRRGADGWRLLMHQNAPTPPPPPGVPGDGQTALV